jgi:hypothetical protein
MKNKMEVAVEVIAWVVVVFVFVCIYKIFR